MNRSCSLGFPLIRYSLGSNGTDDMDQLASFFLVTEMSGVIVRFQTPLIRHGPDLKEMNPLGLVVVVFGMTDAGTGGGHLEVASFENLGVGQRITVGELTVED
jgi:hypothetical protein